MITLDPYLKEVFPEPPITVYKKQKKVKDLIIRAWVHPGNKNKNKRFIKGMKKCQGCIIFPIIRERKVLKGVDVVRKIATPISCKSKNLVYLIECEKKGADRNILGKQKEHWKTE